MILIPDTVFACEGYEQRVEPTGAATGDNEIDGAPDHQRRAWSESGYLRMMPGWARHRRSDCGWHRICDPAGGVIFIGGSCGLKEPRYPLI